LPKLSTTSLAAPRRAYAQHVGLKACFGVSQRLWTAHLPNTRRRLAVPAYRYTSGIVWEICHHTQQDFLELWDLWVRSNEAEPMPVFDHDWPGEDKLLDAYHLSVIRNRDPSASWAWGMSYLPQLAKAGIIRSA
jgi:hypothetical protein